jgi:hypothetical protein
MINTATQSFLSETFGNFERDHGRLPPKLDRLPVWSEATQSPQLQQSNAVVTQSESSDLAVHLSAIR